ncbi:unnamed protein product [Heterosigma akashiwo]
MLHRKRITWGGSIINVPECWPLLGIFEEVLQEAKDHLTSVFEMKYQASTLPMHQKFPWRRRRIVQAFPIQRD